VEVGREVVRCGEGVICDRYTLRIDLVVQETVLEVVVRSVRSMI